MEREYDKTLDLSRGQGRGMQSFERENGKRQSNVISLRWEYLQLSRNFSRLWPLCPCHRLGASVWADELEGAAPATACIKCVSGTLMPTRHKWFGHVLMAIQAAYSPGCFTPSSCWYGSLHCSLPSCSLHKPQGPWCIFHTGFPRCEILKQPVLLGMTSSKPQFFVRGIFFHRCVYCMEQRHRPDSRGSRNVFTSFGQDSWSSDCVA